MRPILQPDIRSATRSTCPRCWLRTSYLVVGEPIDLTTLQLVGQLYTTGATWAMEKGGGVCRGRARMAHVVVTAAARSNWYEQRDTSACSMVCVLRSAIHYGQPRDQPVRGAGYEPSTSPSGGVAEPMGLKFSCSSIPVILTEVPLHNKKSLV